MPLQPRPLGVTLLAILFFINTAVLAVFAVFTFRDPVWLARLMESVSPGSPGPALQYFAGPAIPWITVVGAVIMFVLALGLWRLRPWARIATLVVITLALISIVVLLVALYRHLSPLWLAITAVRFVVTAWFGWYLTRPQVVAAFR